MSCTWLDPGLVLWHPIPWPSKKESGETQYEKFEATRMCVAPIKSFDLKLIKNSDVFDIHFKGINHCGIGLALLLLVYSLFWSQI